MAPGERANALRNLDTLIVDLMAREIDALRAALDAPPHVDHAAFQRGRAEAFRAAQRELRTLRGRLFVGGK